MKHMNKIGIVMLFLLALLAAINIVRELSPQKEEPPIRETEKTQSVIDSAEESLLIGESRVVGLADYGDMHGAHFFSSVGMTVYNAAEVRISVPNVGKVLLEELLNGRKYDKIYLMLGINELGCQFQQTVEQYENLVNLIQKTQPEAKLFLMANLHVTQAWSDTDKTINNPAIDRFNEAISSLADDKTVFYLDANSLFDDETGSLTEQESADGVHLVAEGYGKWGRWLEAQTEEVLSGT